MSSRIFLVIENYRCYDTFMAIFYCEVKDPSWNVLPNDCPEGRRTFVVGMVLRLYCHRD